MDRENAKKIIKILLTDDGGCEYCVSDLLDLFPKEFPEYKELVKLLLKKHLVKTLTILLMRRV